MSSFSTGVTRTWRPSGSRLRTVENRRTIAGDNPKLELSVITLEGAGGALLPNVNRWENQLGLPRSAEEKLAAIRVAMNALATVEQVIQRLEGVKVCQISTSGGIFAAHKKRELVDAVAF